jgi:hypothetical protein
MALLHLICFLAAVISPSLADLDAFFNDPAFDNGAYGPYPVQTYQSTDIISPRPNILQWDRECDNGQYTFWTPRGGRVPEAGALILDPVGGLIWWKGGYDQVYNLMVQQYKGQQYLTFWAGNDAVGGHGAGYYYMVSLDIEKGSTWTDAYSVKRVLR